MPLTDPLYAKRRKILADKAWDRFCARSQDGLIDREKHFKEVIQDTLEAQDEHYTSLLMRSPHRA